MDGYRKKCLFIPAVIFVLLTCPYVLAVGADSSETGFRPETLSEIIAVGAYASGAGTIINVLGNAKIHDYAAETLESPAKLVVDIFCHAGLSKTLNIPVNTDDLETIRIGYHPDKIRLVLDIKEKNLSEPKVFDEAGELIIFLSGQSDETNAGVGTKVFQQIHGKASLSAQSNRPGGLVEGINGVTAEKSDSQTESAGFDRPGNTGDIETGVGAVALGVLSQTSMDPVRSGLLTKKLTRMPLDDGREDTGMFIECIDDYESQEWPLAVEKLKRFIEIYPTGDYTERALFLLAKARDQSLPEPDSKVFNKILGEYEQAIHRYPASIHVPEALLGIGNLYSRHKNYHEALGYYNLILKNNRDSIHSVTALVRKAKILLLRKKREEALEILPVLEVALSKYPNVPEICSAKTEMAKILYEANSFRKSLEILIALTSENPGNLDAYPDISLYLGYDYYQLGDILASRRYLIRFYNMCPERDINHLVLAQIGDTYREAGQNKEAIKFYEKVLGQYPESEGATICLIRMAEQQEEGTLSIHRGIQTPIKLIGHDIGLPRDIYKQVAHKLVYQNSKNPLLQLALVKLAVLYQKEKDYKKSLIAIKELLENNPWASLRKEIKDALFKLVETILEEEMKNGNFSKVIEIYQQEKKLFAKIKSPGVLLVVARALRELGIEGAAIDMFKKADRRFQEHDRPPDLLLILSYELFKNEAYASALKRLDYYLENHPNDKNIVKGYRLKGEIYLKNKRYIEAADLFSEILKKPISRCERLKVIADRAKALAKGEYREKAFASMAEIDHIIDACPERSMTYQEIGNLYRELGYIEKAVPLLENAKKLSFDGAKNYPLIFNLAQCYLQLDQKQKSIELYHQVAEKGNPFWSNLAKEKITEIDFEKILSKRTTPEIEKKASIDAKQENTDSTK
jgi:tetratricopeptide (TPR) repeat protein